MADEKTVVAMIERHILDCAHNGHRIWCAAIKGPDGENWYEDDKCDCSRKAALSALREYVGGASQEMLLKAQEHAIACGNLALELQAALADLSNLYGHAWDRVDGALVMMGSSVQKFEAAHERAREALKKRLPISPRTALK